MFCPRTTYDNNIVKSISDTDTKDIWVLGWYLANQCGGTDNNNADCWVGKLSPYGDMVFWRTFGRSSNADDKCSDMDISLDNYLYIVGDSYMTADRDVVIYKISSLTGGYSYGRSWGSSSAYNNYGRGLRISPDGASIYVLGTTNGGITNPIISTVENIVLFKMS